MPKARSPPRCLSCRSRAASGRPDDGAHRGRRLRHGQQPPGARGRRGTGRARRRRHPCLRRPGVPGESTGRRSRGSRPRSSRAVTTTRSRTPLGPPRSTSSRSRATCGSSARRRSRRFQGRILNTHPSLLPAFPGSHAVRDALEHGAKVTGCTVHIVDATLDGGPDRAPGSRPRSLPAMTRRRSTAGSRPSSTGCCRGPWRSLVGGALPIEGRGARAGRRRRRSRAAGAAARAAVGQRQDRPRRSGSWAARSSVRARLDGRHGTGAARRRPGRDRRERRHGLPGDPRRAGEDPPPGIHGGRPRGSPARGPSARRCSRRGSRHSSSSSSTCIPSPPRPSDPGSRSMSSSRRSTSAARPWSARQRRITPPWRSSRPRRDTRRSSPPWTSPAASRSDSARRSRSRRSDTPPPTTRGSPPSCRAGWTKPASPCPPSPACLDRRTRSRRSWCCPSRRSRRCATARTPTSRPPAIGARTGEPARRRPVRDRRAAAPGQGAVVQQRARRLRRREPGAAAPRPGVRGRQAHEPVRRRRAADAPRGLAGRPRRRPAGRVRRGRRAHRRGRGVTSPRR